MPAMKTPVILSRLRGVQRCGSGSWVAFCPAHPDQKKRSLSVKVVDDGKTLLYCFVGCSTEAVCNAISISLADLSASSTNGQRSLARRIIATYDYCDERGELLFQEIRFEPKDFRLRRPDGHDGWTWDLKDTRRVVYRLDELAEQRRAWLVEGPKDADGLWALGIPATTTPGGASAWRDEYAEQIRAAGAEEVIACRDNDEAGLSYVRRAAGALTHHAVTVRMLDLPGLPVKGDVSDYIDMQRAAGRTDEEIRVALLAVADAAPTFEAETMAGSTPATTEPELRREGFDLVLTLPDHVRFSLSSIHDTRDGVRGELTVTHGARRLSWGSLALSSTQAREGLRKKLEATAPGLPWAEYLDDAAFRLTQAARQGEPIVTLTGKVTSPTRELMPRLLYEGEPTLVYADGDTGKSLFALAVACAMQSGTALPFGLKPARAVPAAYLDWETGRDTIESRLALLAAGLGIDPPPILYKRMTRPLVDEAQVLATDFARRGIGFVVIDSKMFAVAGGDGAAFHEPITGFYNALRLFAPAATLVLNHITNAEAKSGSPARPFGGAFAFNGPRLNWEAKRDHDVDDATAIVFTCKKANNLPRKPEPFGLRFAPGNGTITVYPLDLSETAVEALAGTSISYRLRLALARGTATPDNLAEELGKDIKTIKRLLRRLREQHKAQDRPDGSWELTSPSS